MVFRKRSFQARANNNLMSGRKWRVRLGAAAELDFANILKWTTENFGARQSRIYRDTLIQAIGDLADGPDVAGSRGRDEIMPGLRTLHIARHGQPGRHFILYRAVEGRIIEIGRILHGQMDLGRHLPFFNFLKKENGPVLSVEEMNQIAARGWAGKR